MKESSLSTLDFLMLHTTFDVFANPKTAQNCNAMLDRFDRFEGSDRELRIEAFLAARGCGGRPSIQIYKFAPFLVKTCLCTFQNRTRFGHIWGLFDQYEKHGNLPFEGALSNQPSQLLEAFDVLRGLKHSFEEKMNKKRTK